MFVSHLCVFFGEMSVSFLDLGLIPGLGRSPGDGKGYPLQYSGLENSMDCIVHGIAKSQTRPSDCSAKGPVAFPAPLITSESAPVGQLD